MTPPKQKGRVWKRNRRPVACNWVFDCPEHRISIAFSSWGRAIGFARLHAARHQR